MKFLKLVKLLVIGLLYYYPLFAQNSRTPFPLSEQQISFKIDSLRKVYLPYNKKVFSSLSQAEKEKIMIAKANEAILVFAPDYYREYKNPLIKMDTVSDANGKKVWTKTYRKTNTIVSTNKAHIGKICYRISFQYDITKENLGVPYIAIFSVVVETGEPVSLHIPATALFVPFDKRPFEERVKEKRLPEDRIKYRPYVEGTRY